MTDKIPGSEDKVGICILCDKDIEYTDNAVVGKQSGEKVHATCYTTWLREKMRGKDT